MKALIVIVLIGLFVAIAFVPPNGWPTIKAVVEVNVEDASFKEVFNALPAIK